MDGPTPAWLLGLWCLFSIMLPAWLLIGGALPFWHRLRAFVGTQAVLRGANAAVVGVLLAALYNPVIRESVRDIRDVVAVLLAFALLEFRKTPPWAMVLALAAAGQLLLG